MKEIQTIAGGIVERYGTASPFELCDFMEIPVLKLELPRSMRGFCFRKDRGGPVIVLNEELRRRDREYCCAHELGHVLLHPKMNEQVISDLTNLCVQRFEREADYFAACLLIDPNLEEWNRTYRPLTLEQIASLSGLPERIVGLRFGQ
jgi:Zn-dependent peptidase ImmA (M78 family)